MARVRCATFGCPSWVREGGRKHGSDNRGRPLADGRFCWRCRQGISTHIRRGRE